MLSANEATRKVLEEFILAESEQDRMAVMQKLVPGSWEYNYIYLMQKLNKDGSALTKDDRTLFDKVIAGTNTSYDRRQKLKIREALLRYDTAKTDKERDEAIANLNKNFCSVNPSHSEPHFLKNKPGNQAAQQKELKTQTLEVVFDKKAIVKQAEKDRTV